MILTELRKVYNISMQELADNIKVSKQLIGHIEKGKREISDEVLVKLVDYFQLQYITANYREFMSKESLGDVEALKIKRNKLILDIREIDLQLNKTT